MMRPCIKCAGTMAAVPHRPAWSGFSDYAAQCQTCNFVFNPHARRLDVLRFSYNTYYVTQRAQRMQLVVEGGPAKVLAPIPARLTYA